jgi:hypothetical protein
MGKPRKGTLTAGVSHVELQCWVIRLCPRNHRGSKVDTARTRATLCRSIGYVSRARANRESMPT